MGGEEKMDSIAPSIQGRNKEEAPQRRGKRRRMYEDKKGAIKHRHQQGNGVLFVEERTPDARGNSVPETKHCEDENGEIEGMERKGDEVQMRRDEMHQLHGERARSLAVELPGRQGLLECLGGSMGDARARKRLGK
ncbi:hypothetical protein DVH05_005603 [Phytophthora capsici]|nr:hypothetical protein DVH05_005603 [Phytophthora capsici]